MPKSLDPSLALPKFDREEKTLDVRLRLKGKPALDLIDYQRIYAAKYGEALETELLAQHILTTFLDGDKVFQTLRKRLLDTESAK